MSSELAGKRIAFLVANEGVEHVELTTPWQAVEDAGTVRRAPAPDGAQHPHRRPTSRRDA